MSGRKSRAKGARIEHAIVKLHAEAGIEAEKISRSGYAGDDIRIVDLYAEVKARKDGKGFAQLEKWLGDSDMLFLRRDRKKPLVLLPWETYLQLMQLYYTHYEIEPRPF